MGWPGRVATAAAVAAVVAPAVGAQPSVAPANRRLQPFGSCSAYLAYVKAQAAPFVTAYGLGRPVGGAVGPAVPSAKSAPQQGVDYSGTNVQEGGVDEPDQVKTNGSTLFAVENGSLEAVDVGEGRPKLLDTLKLDGGWSHELLLSGRHLLVLTRGGFWAEPLPAVRAAMFLPQPSSSTLTEVDVSDPAALKVVQTLQLDGAYLDARMIGSTVRVVSSTSVPGELPYATPSGSTPAALAAAQATNRGIVSSSRAASWLPSYRLGKQPPRPLVNCRRIRRPAVFSGLGMVTVTTLDLAKGLAPVDSTAVMTDGRIVYASPTTLYLATEPWTARPLPLAPTTAPSTAATQIHAFSIADPTKTTYLGSGTVPGYLLSQWSLSELGGVLRVVSTDTPAWWGGGPNSQSYLTELRLQNGALARVGQVDGLGRGDRVYAVRMIGRTGYVVTFKQIDPLYTIDLRDPAHPQLLGSLDLPGYSSYLHPISSTLLLGIGQSIDQAGTEPDGTQVSLFDVADPKHPRLLQQERLGQGWSLAESDHHAFLYWPAANLVVVPFGQQAVALRVSRTGISELGRIIHSQARQSQLPQIDRSLVVGNALLTVSSGGTAANRLTNLAAIGWAPFPPPEPTPVPGPVPVPGTP